MSANGTFHNVKDDPDHSQCYNISTQLYSEDHQKNPVPTGGKLPFTRLQNRNLHKNVECACPTLLGTHWRSSKTKKKFIVRMKNHLWMRSKQSFPKLKLVFSHEWKLEKNSFLTFFNLGLRSGIKGEDVDPEISKLKNSICRLF